jgi:rare lipoprotein A
MVRIYALSTFLFLSMITCVGAASAKTVTATWYGGRFAGQPMANGKLFNPQDPRIAAGPVWLVGKRLRLTNLRNRRSIIVEVQDRMPNGSGKNHIDLSWAGADRLGFVLKGVTLLTMQELPSH